MRRRAAFTLIELMVAIGIVLVISAIVFPVYAQAKGAARRTECLSNVRQITAATLMYMEEHGDIPMGTVLWNPMGISSWLTLIGVANRNSVVLKCPEYRPKFLSDYETNGKSGYVTNRCLGRTRLRMPPDDPSRTVLVGERGSFVSVHGISEDDAPEQFPGPDCLWYTPEVIRKGGYKMYTPYACRRHQGGANYGMLDGRVVWRRPEQVRYLDAEDPCDVDGGGKWLGPEDGISYQILSTRN